MARDGQTRTHRSIPDCAIVEQPYRRGRINVKPRIDFGDHEQWTAYVRREVPPQDQGYVLTLSRTDLFRRFYEARGRAFPEVFSQELDRIGTLDDPERTEALVA